MNILIAPNSFKQCLSAGRVGEAIAAGVRLALPDAEIKILPLSDGGDGLLDACARCLPAEYVKTAAFDPLMRPIKASWLKAGEEAIIEMARVSGLALLNGPAEYDPMLASTFGTGQLIKAALDSGCRTIVIGLGGSATVDAACGMADALGFKMPDENVRQITPGGGGLGRLNEIIASDCDARLREAKIICITDVRSPLLGPNGAARLFGPQKGATPEQVEILERNLAHWADIVERDLNLDIRNVAGAGAAGGAGAGAAGGAGAGCAAFFNATLQGGAEWVGKRIGLEEAVAGADIIFTGEGKIDSQTAFGKIPEYVGRLAMRRGKRVVALGGAVEEGTDLSQAGISECRCINPPGISLAEAFRAAEKNLALTAKQVMMEFYC